MSAATTLKSPTRVYGHKQSSSRSSRPSTTPRSPPGSTSVADSATAHHSSQNWILPDYGASGNAPASPRPLPPEANVNLDAFRMQSEKGSDRFHLGPGLSHLPGVSSASATASPGHISPSSQHHQQPSGARTNPALSIPRSESPVSMLPRHNVRHHESTRLRRSDTLPPSPQDHEPHLVGPSAVADLLRQSARVLILDLRVYQQYAGSRIQGGLNLCIPTTLLKRPSFTLRRLAETFSRAADRERFERWREHDYIVVYDACSTQAKEAVTCFNVLKKFTAEGWGKPSLVIKGGFHAFARFAPDLVDSGPINSGAPTADRALSIAPPDRHALAVAGGCTMPSAECVANPFFGNIRQNMDLLDGVGQMPINKPRSLTERGEKTLPAWLRAASRASDHGKTVSDRFLAIEKLEQKRMRNALSTKVAYGSPAAPQSPPRVQVAGIEKGSKNRYNNIFPYDHCRVRLQGVPRGDCDYINASHVKAEYSNRRYIATQAPIPSTFNDFWRVVWEQQVSVIVMLTAESEGGLLKSHPYWTTGEYGSLKATLISERQVSLEPRPSLKNPVPTARPSLGQRRATAGNFISSADRDGEQAPVQSPGPGPASVTLRTLRLSHPAGSPPREVVQVQYAQWPDFGAPTSPSVLLALIELVNKCVRNQRSSSEPGPRQETPILVHCSAGCGRTGTYCTIDSVIDMLKTQRLAHAQRHQADSDTMHVDHAAWIERDDEDLIAKTVEDFRHQRLSMVQNLRQFVLCYETVLLWLVNQLPDTNKADKIREMRKSYQA
ncbi:hypothetical protein DV735_g2075, partial [Chaetothyriales sp. CBS 134920]